MLVKFSLRLVCTPDWPKGKQPKEAKSYMSIDRDTNFAVLSMTRQDAERLERSVVDFLETKLEEHARGSVQK